ncbi:MAG: helix-turn-helix domain-containing protein [Sedimentisphaeraceae bacterium JB056]
MSSQQLQGLNITVINTELAKCDSSWDYSSVNSPFSRLYLILEGEGEVVHSGRRFKLSSNKMFLVPAFTESSYKCPEHMLHYYIHFTHSSQDELSLFERFNVDYLIDAQRTDYYLFKRLLDLNPGKALIERDPAKYHKRFQMKRSFQMADRMGASEYLESTGIIIQLISRFVKDNATKPQEKMHIPKQSLHKIIGYINRNLDKQISISDLAKFMFVSKDHFSKVFLKTTGVRPTEYITIKRIERSQMLLLSTELGLEQIAIRCGFSSSSHLSRQFRKYLNTSPGNYRRKHS